MRKFVISLIIGMMVVLCSLTVNACPRWECQYPVDYYGCGCPGASSYSATYTESYTQSYTQSYTTATYCQYCGNHTWDCVCGNYSNDCSSNYNDYDSDCNYDYNNDYDYGYGCSSYSEYNDYDSECSSSSYTEMSHWANIRDCNGNIIGQAGCGDSIEVVGVDCNDSSRVLIYDYTTGTYGSVLRECVYGGYQWDGSGDNGYYNCYQGDNYDSWDDVSSSSYTDCNYNDCDYDNYDCSGYDSGCSSVSSGCIGTIGTTYVAYSEIIRNYVAMTTYGSYGSYNCGYNRGCM